MVDLVGIEPTTSSRDDFLFAPAEGVTNALNMPSPAATESLVIGPAIVDLAQKTFSLR